MIVKVNKSTSKTSGRCRARSDIVVQYYLIQLQDIVLRLVVAFDIMPVCRMVHQWVLLSRLVHQTDLAFYCPVCDSLPIISQHFPPRLLSCLCSIADMTLSIPPDPTLDYPLSIIGNYFPDYWIHKGGFTKLRTVETTSRSYFKRTTIESVAQICNVSLQHMATL
jgi:hypothetical protein